MVYCSKCGSENEDKSIFCQNCGNNLKKFNNIRDVSPWMARHLAFWSGPLGYCYLGKYKEFVASIVGILVIVFFYSWMSSLDESNVISGAYSSLFFLIWIFFIIHQNYIAQNMKLKYEKMTVNK